jgi:hypothetical protein
MKIQTEASWKAIKYVYIETSDKILGFRENHTKGMDFRGDMKRNRNEEIGKRKCKQKQNKTNRKTVHKHSI